MPGRDRLAPAGFAIPLGGLSVRKVLAACLVGGGLAMTDGAALGHHSFSMFDMSLPTEIEGTVEDFKLTNPHSSLLVKAKDKDGRATTWRLEGGSPSVLDRAGWNAKTLKPGASRSRASCRIRPANAILYQSLSVESRLPSRIAFLPGRCSLLCGICFTRRTGGDAWQEYPSH